MLRFLFLMHCLLCAAGNAVVAATDAPIRISVTSMPVSAPVWIARDLGLFEKAGVQVVIKPYSLGKLALEDLKRHELDLASAAVTPLVYARLAGEEFRIVANLSTSTGLVAVVARKDRDITNPSDLAGKTIGISAGTSAEFFFDCMRVLYRVPKTSVKVENRSVDRLMDGVQDGSLDGICIWEPLISQLKRKMPGKLAYFYGPGLFTFSWNLVALPETVQNRRGEIEKIMAALFEAAEFIQENPDDAGQVLIKGLGENGRDVADHLDEARFTPVLDQDLLVRLEAESRWIIARDGKTNATPNFLRCIDTSILKKVRPGAVTLIQ